MWRSSFILSQKPKRRRRGRLHCIRWCHVIIDSCQLSGNTACTRNTMKPASQVVVENGCEISLPKPPKNITPISLSTTTCIDPGFNQYYGRVRSAAKRKGNLHVNRATKALILAYEDDVVYGRSLKSVAGVIFMGTPQREQHSKPRERHRQNIQYRHNCRTKPLEQTCSIVNYLNYGSKALQDLAIPVRNRL